MGIDLDLPAAAWPASTLLGSLGVNDRSALLNTGTKDVRGDRRRLLTQGRVDDHAFLLVSGVVKVVARDHNGQPALLAIRMAGDLVGEMAALERTASNRTPRSADVTACGPVEVRVIKSDELCSLMRSRPEISLGVARMITRRLRWSNDRRVDFMARSPQARVARILYEIIRAYGSQRRSYWDLGVPLVQEEIASLAGTKLRTAQKWLSDFKASGVLVTRYGAVHVVDLEALKSIAED